MPPFFASPCICTVYLQSLVNENQPCASVGHAVWPRRADPTVWPCPVWSLPYIATSWHTYTLACIYVWFICNPVTENQPCVSTDHDVWRPHNTVFVWSCSSNHLVMPWGEKDLLYRARLHWRVNTAHQEHNMLYYKWQGDGSVVKGMYTYYKRPRAFYIAAASS